MIDKYLTIACMTLLVMAGGCGSVTQERESGLSPLLLTEKAYRDFFVSVTYKVEWPCNSGVWFRYQLPDKAYQADILEYKKPECYSGTLYCPGKMFLAMNTV